MFKHIMGLKELKPMVGDPHTQGEVIKFDQRPFVDMSLVPDKANYTQAGFKEDGYLFVPNACKHS